MMEFKDFVQAIEDAAQHDNGFYINPGKEPTYEFESWSDSIVVVFHDYLVLMVRDTSNSRVPVIYNIATPKELEILDGRLVFDVNEIRLNTSLEDIWAKNICLVDNTTIPTRQSFKRIALDITTKFNRHNLPADTRTGTVEGIIYTFSPTPEKIAKTDVYVAYRFIEGSPDEKLYLKRLIELNPERIGFPTVTYSWTTDIKEAFRFDFLYSTTAISGLIHHICGPKFGCVGIASAFDTKQDKE